MGQWVTNLQTEFNYLYLLTFYSVFKILTSSAPGEWGRWVEEYLETQKGSHTCTHTCVHICINTHACITKTYVNVKKLQIAATMEAAMFIMINMYGYVCVNVCVHMHEYVHKSGTDSTHPNLHPTTHPPATGGTPENSINSISLEQIKINQFCLQIWNLCRLPHL